MKKWLFLILLFISGYLYSQNRTYTQDLVYEGMQHENILTLRWGGIWQYDEYLSPLLYKEYFIALQNEWWQGFNKGNRLKVKDNWEHVGKVKLQGGRMYNEAYSNMIYALGVQGGWGAHYDLGKLTGVDGFQLFIGPYLDVDLMGRELINNVNKPYSIDCSADLKAHAGIGYSFSGKKTSYRIRYTVMTTLAGAQFVPEYGQSYYEVTEGIIGGTIGFSSLHNHLTLRHEFTFDMQFPHSAWRLGVEHEYIRHNMNNLHFQREQLSLVVGVIFNYKTIIRKL